MTTRRAISPATTGLLLVVVALILCVAGWVFRRAQHGKARHQQFLEIKTKAEQGDAQAQANLGDEYFFGEVTAKDQVEAVKWWRKAAEQGDPKSQFSLAFSYFQGLGVEKDAKEGFKWYQSTVDQGYDVRDVSTRLTTGVSIKMKSVAE